MKQLLLVALVLLGGCGFFEGDDYATKAAIAAPDTTQKTDDGLTLYGLPGPVLDDVGYVLSEESQEVCEIETFYLYIEPQIAKHQVVTFYYKDISNSRTIDRGELNKEDFKKMLASGHLHVQSAVLFVGAGDPFDFLAWVKIYTEGTLVVWGGPFDDKRIRAPLRVDGSIDLAENVTDLGLVLNFTIRAKAPDHNTYIGAEIELLRFFDCKYR